MQSRGGYRRYEERSGGGITFLHEQEKLPIKISLLCTNINFFILLFHTHGCFMYILLLFTKICFFYLNLILTLFYNTFAFLHKRDFFLHKSCFCSQIIIFFHVLLFCTNVKFYLLRFLLLYVLIYASCK